MVVFAAIVFSTLYTTVLLNSQIGLVQKVIRSLEQHSNSQIYINALVLICYLINTLTHSQGLDQRLI